MKGVLGAEKYLPTQFQSFKIVIQPSLPAQSRTAYVATSA